MKSLSREVIARDLYKTGKFATDETIVTFRGFTKDLATELDTNEQAIYRAISAMEAMGCVERIIQGRNSPSTYLLIKEPDVEEYHQVRDVSLVTGQLELPTKYQRMQDAINRYLERLEKNELELAKIQTLIKVLEQRIRAMEERSSDKDN